MNRLVVGDARECIYRAKPNSVELAFLDPPFNTGKDFGDYYDKRTRDEWLDLMSTVLMRVRRSLTPTGCIWVNLDERMHAHCRLLLDDLFGEDCYVATICWRKKYRASNSLGIHTVHNPILVYSRNPGWQRKRGLKPRTEHVAKYRNPDNDPRGLWRNTHAGTRTYLSELMERGAMPDTWWDYDEAGYTELAANEVKGITGHTFSTPKPLALLRRIVTLSANRGDLVVDPFAGSGTALVAAHEAGCKWLGIEQSEQTVRRFIIPRLDNARATYSIEGI